MNSLSNKILLAVMIGDRHGSSVDQLYERLAGSWVVALVAGHPLPVSNPFDSLARYHSVLDEVIALELDGLLEVVPGGLTRVTERGLRHIVSILTCGSIAESGEDLGDVSDHLLTPIPTMQLWGHA